MFINNIRRLHDIKHRPEPSQARHTRSRHALPIPSKAQPENNRLYGIMRFFSVASLVCIILAAIALTILYRQVAIRDIINFGEHSNLVLAQGFLNAVKTPLVTYLSQEGAHHGPPLPPDLEQAIQGLMENTSVARIKIYDNEGIITYSTYLQQIGEDSRDNAGYQSAIKGAVLSKLSYRDNFNPFDKETESDNLIQSYVPIRTNPTSPILGVFEICTDVNPMIAEIERGQLWVIIVGSATLTLLYLALIATVRHAEHIIKRQQLSIRERSHALEILSSQLLSAQEQEKKRVAHELHEGIIQTLGSIKFQVENASSQLSTDPGKSSLQAVIPLLQTTITEIRSLAMELHPSSLDDMGLIATLNWYCRELKNIYPDLTLEKTIGVRESDITPPLKVILYRVIQQAVQNFLRHHCTSRIGINLTKKPTGIQLQISNDCGLQDMEEYESDSWVAIQERIALSGGASEISASVRGGSTLSAVWAS